MSRPDSALAPRQREIFVFWIPLAATWLMMSAEGPLIAAIIARLDVPVENLAAYGIAFSLALLLEAPVIMMLSAATALVRGARSYRKLRNFTQCLNAGITGGMLLLLVPSVFDAIIKGAIGIPEPVAKLSYGAVALLLPWPGAIGIRRFYQGVLIRHGRTRRVAYGTVVRLASMAGTAFTLAGYGHLSGAHVGAAALSVGVLAEALTSRVLAGPVIRTLLTSDASAAEPEDTLSYPGILRFYYPLVLTTLLAMGIQPLISFSLARSYDAIQSLAVMPVVLSLTFIFRSFGLAFQEVGIALVGTEGEGYKALRRFATVLGFTAGSVLSLVAWTPMASLWFESISGLSPELTAVAILPARVLGLMPALTVWISFQRAMLVNAHRTRHISLATGLEVLGVIAGLVVGIHYLDLSGAFAAGGALMLGRVLAVSYLIWPFHKLTRRILDRHDTTSAASV